MRIFSNISNLNFRTENINKIPHNTVATIGCFDGVHIGHKFLITQLQHSASENNTDDTIITMWKHPALFFSREIKLLTTLEEKIKIFHDLNIKNLVILDFNSDLATMNTVTFIQEMLINTLQIRKLLIGYNNTFGNDKISDISTLHLIESEKAEKFLFNNKEKVSSSIIRKLLTNNELEITNQFLGYEFNFSGKVVRGYGNGEKLGFPTANIELEDNNKIIPSNGVYISATKINSHDYWLPSLLNIGIRPTFRGQVQSIENHILDFNNNLYEKILTVKPIKKIRDEIEFSTLKDLSRQIENDRNTAKEFFTINK